MFFYRAWAGNEERFPQTAVYGPEIFVSQFYNYRWGYASLLILTLLASLLLNAVFLASFSVNSSKQKFLPHILFFCLSIRDLLVALILIPICVHWYIVNAGFFEADEILCRFSAFLEFFLAAEYPILLITLSIVLYTRKYPKPEDRIYGLQLEEYENGEIAPMASRFMAETPSLYQTQSQMRNPYRESLPIIKNPYRESPPIHGQHRQTPPMQGQYRASSLAKSPSLADSMQAGQGRRAPSVMSDGGRSRRAPSVVGSDSGPRPGSRGFQPQRPVILNNDSSVPRKSASVTTSMEGRLANGRRVSQLQQQQQRFLTSSPLREEEEGSADLWDAVSLDYPGKQSPDDWGFLGSEEDPHSYEEPRFHTWHYWLLGLTWALALAVGIPASLFVEYQPLINTGGTGGSRGPRKGRPGCFMPADPFKNPYSHTVDDPGFNFTLSNLVIAYILPTVLLVFMLLMIYCRKLTDNNKFRRYVKLLTMLTFVFFISRSPMDILQLKGIVEAAMGFKQLNLLPYQLEYEILLVWSTYLPLLLNPVVYFCFCSEYRTGGWRAIRSMCGCPLPTEDEKFNLDTKYKEVEIMSSRSSVSKTQKSNML